MGATFFIGYLENKSLHVTLNRGASNLIEALLDETLQYNFPEIHQMIMEVLVLDQINFTELNTSDFNLVIRQVRKCLSSRIDPSEAYKVQKMIWEETIEPLIQQDKRYQKD